MATRFDTNYATETGTRVKINLTPSRSTSGSPIALTAIRALQGSGNPLHESHAFGVGEDKDSSQLTKLETPEFPHLPGAPSFKLSERYKAFDLTVVGGPPLSHAGNDLIPAGTIYLFNVLVALEWLPSKRTIDMLMRAFSAASDVLYDATNGGMAFGQVVFAGPDYLNRADVQVLASNRFHPRSMVNGLTDADKYSAVRLGRGIWRKDRRVLLPWDENTGYRAIAHEWAHYALGLHDEYIDATLRVVPQGNRLVEDPWGTPIVVPRVMVSLMTLMETLDADELVPLQKYVAKAGLVSPQIVELGDRIANLIDSRYIGLKDRLLANNPGPIHFPVAFPRFFHLPDLTITDDEETDCNVDGVALEHCWLYSYAYQPGDHNQRATLQILAQGRIDDRAKTDLGILPLPGAWFEVLGEASCDQLLAIGLNIPKQPAGTPRPQGTPAIQVGDRLGSNWAPLANSAWTPVVAVVPVTTGLDWPSMQVRVSVNHSTSPTNVWLSLPGDGPQTPIDLTVDHAITHMDGIVALELIDKAGSQRWVAEFSYGGNPPTTVKSPGAPISAGSSDGNLMIFSQIDNTPQPGSERKEDYKTSIVTTRNYAGFEDKNGTMLPAGYLFSVASSDVIDTAKLHPTIVMYYDGDSLSEDSELVIHRYDMTNERWQALPTYLPSGSAYVATPINSITAPNLVAVANPTNGRIEYYRLFSVPR